MWTKQQFNDYQRKRGYNATRTRVPEKPKQVDQSPNGEALGGEAVGAQYCLRRVEIDFFANHGKELDQDNRRFIAKPILDALVNIGFASDDKNISSETTQRMDKTDINF